MEMYKKYKPSKEYLAYLDSLPKSFFVTVLENSYKALWIKARRNDQP